MTKAADITVHQALHGYSEGHRELAASFRLKPKDAKTLLVLSDISSSGLRIGSNGYLTGYPLGDSGYFALARTWPATEVQRPGAVWTHTLLIEYSDLATVRDLRILLPLFVKPATDSVSLFARFGRSIKLSAPAHSALIDDTSTGLAWAKRLVWCLYAKPSGKVVATIPPGLEDSADDIVLSIWSQQWPRLRRSFRFCTLTSADRSIDKASFDLQLLPDLDRVFRSRFGDAVFAQDEEIGRAPWIERAMSDLEKPQFSALREFMQKVGSDVSSGRKAFAPLVMLNMLLSNESSVGDNLIEAIHLLEVEFGSSNIAARQLVVSAVARSAFALDSSTLEFVLQHIDSMPEDELQNYAATIGAAVWKLSPERLSMMLEGSTAQKSVVNSTLTALDDTDLINGLVHSPGLVTAALERRPSLIQDKRLWILDRTVASQAVYFVANNASISENALRSIFTSDSAELIEDVFTNIDHQTIWQSLASELDTENSSMSLLAPWLRRAVADKDATAYVLANHMVTNKNALASIARLTYPDAIPNEYGDDPWVTAANSWKGAVSDTDAIYLACYLLARALGTASRNTASLVELSFSKVYKEAASNRIEPDAWRLIDSRLPRPYSWQEWNRCQQLCYGIAQVYVRRGLPPSSFAKLGNSDADFAEIAGAAAKEWHGKSYLREVRQFLNENGGRKSSPRMRDIDRLLDSWLSW